MASTNGMGSWILVNIGSVMTCGLTAPSHCLRHCWPNSLWPYGVTSLQWVKSLRCWWKWHLELKHGYAPARWGPWPEPMMIKGFDVTMGWSNQLTGVKKKCWNINSKTPVLHCIECNKLNNTTRFTTREKWTLTAVNRYLQTTKKGVSDLRLISILNNNKKNISVHILLGLVQGMLNWHVWIHTTCLLYFYSWGEKHVHQQ